MSDCLIAMIWDAKTLAHEIKNETFAKAKVTVVGLGGMGQQYLKALQALRVENIRVVTRNHRKLEKLSGIQGVAKGYQEIDCEFSPKEWVILSLPQADLLAAARHLGKLGVQKMLIEKPVSLFSAEIGKLGEEFKQQGVEAYVAYNRVAYPALFEVLSRSEEEGGITSCCYTFTEMIRDDWESRFPSEELARWGVSNSLHVIGMAHRFIGFPETLQTVRSGAERISWHPPVSTFVGSGLSKAGIPFVYHADWGGKGRWGVEIHTKESIYSLSPMEKVFCKKSPLGDWKEIPVETFSPDIKTGIVEEVASCLSPKIHRQVPLYSLKEGATLTRLGEKIFGYVCPMKASNGGFLSGS